MEVGRERMEFENVGTVSIGDLGDTKSMGSDDAREAAEGVGELMRVLDAAMEELVLGVAREGGNEFEVKFINGRGSGEVFEVRVQGAQEDVGPRC